MKKKKKKQQKDVIFVKKNAIFLKDMNILNILV